MGEVSVQDRDLFMHSVTHTHTHVVTHILACNSILLYEHTQFNFSFESVSASAVLEQDTEIRELIGLPMNRRFSQILLFILLTHSSICLIELINRCYDLCYTNLKVCFSEAKLAEFQRKF